MNESVFEKIEQYVNGGLTQEEVINFESELTINGELASMVKLYSTIDTEMRNNERFSEEEIALKKTLNRLNATYFKSGSQQAKENVTPVKKLKTFQWISYAIAASVIILVAVLFLNKTSPQRLANNYVSKNLTILSVTMNDSSDDTLQAGIAAYNNKQYDRALQFFKNYNTNHPQSGSVKEYLALVYLITKNYDSALHRFDELSNQKGLYTNPGMFLKAVTLLQRNKEGDKEQAKQLLQQVSRQKLDGNREAEEWIKEL